MKPKSEAWVKRQVKEIFKRFGCADPYMPSPVMYGKAGAADFVEVMFGAYVAIETKKLGNTQTELQKRFEQGVRRRGGIYMLVYENNLDEVRSMFAYLERTPRVQVPQ